MSNDTTISVSAETRDRLAEHKEQDDRYFTGEEPFDRVITRLLDAYEGDDGDADAPADGDGIDTERVEQALATIEERTGRIEQQLDDLGGGRR